MGSALLWRDSNEITEHSQGFYRPRGGSCERPPQSRNVLDGWTRGRYSLAQIFGLGRNFIFWNNFKYLAIFAATVPAADSWARERDAQVIYGEDDRSEVDENQGAPQRFQARAVALITSRSQLEYDNVSYRLQGRNFGEEYSLCPQERFYEQTVLGTCTGFLVADDILVTASHCIESEWACSESAVIFGYDDKETFRNNHVYKADPADVYFCKEVIKSKYDIAFELDFSIVRLDRKVAGREPLKYRSAGRLSSYEQLYTIGHPAGLSQKISTRASIRKNSSNAYFTAGIDTIAGASGSPVFASSTGLVEGVLMNGEYDFVLTPDGCYESQKCPETGDQCSGEFIQRFSEILPYLPK